MNRTKAMLTVLRSGREPELAKKILRVFGASSIDECCTTYDALGAAERESLDAGLALMTKDAPAAFLLSVANVERR